MIGFVVCFSAECVGDNRSTRRPELHDVQEALTGDSSEEGHSVRDCIDSCDHYFCFLCIVEWSKIESRCPLCKGRSGQIRRMRTDGSFIGDRAVVVPLRNQGVVASGPSKRNRSTFCNTIYCPFNLFPLSFAKNLEKFLLNWRMQKQFEKLCFSHLVLSVDVRLLLSETGRGEASIIHKEDGSEVDRRSMDQVVWDLFV